MKNDKNKTEESNMSSLYSQYLQERLVAIITERNIESQNQVHNLLREDTDQNAKE